MSTQEPEDLWLFGYGSLIFKPPPKFDLRVPGYIEGYVRRFWQVRTRYASLKRAEHFAGEDHRGTPEDPGRVVTLIERSHWESLVDEHAEAPERVWGAAYRIPAKDAAEMKEYLDIREINGYSIQYAPFHVSGSTAPQRPEQDMTAHYVPLHPSVEVPGLEGPIQCLVYIGLPSNPQFLGPQDPQALAEKIVRSRGPSGKNVEYLLELEKALDGLSPESGDKHISDLASRCRKILAAKHIDPAPLEHVSSTDGREEVEKA